MSEIGGRSDEAKDEGARAELAATGDETSSTLGESGTREDPGTSTSGELAPASPEQASSPENMEAREPGSPAAEGKINESVPGNALETGASQAEVLSPASSELARQRAETRPEIIQVMLTPESLEQAQKEVESFHLQSVEQILKANGKYMSESDKERILQGVDEIKAVEHDPALGRTGGYLFLNKRSSIEISAINQQQMERSTKHETNHFASQNKEIIILDPENKGYTVYQTVGARQASWFHSQETGEISNFKAQGRGLNEGLTTMYTNQQLRELSLEKGEAAERQAIYAQATEVCGQLEEILGEDTLKEAYYGGKLKDLERKIDDLAGEKAYESLRENLDKTLDKDYGERVKAMKNIQSILAKMHEKGRRKS